MVSRQFPIELFEAEPGFILAARWAFVRSVVSSSSTGGGLGQSDPISGWDGSGPRPVDRRPCRGRGCVGGPRTSCWWAGTASGSPRVYVCPRTQRVFALVLYEPTIVVDDDWASWSEHRVQRGAANVRGTRIAPPLPSRVSWIMSFVSGTCGRVDWGEPVDGTAYLGVGHAVPSPDSLYEQIELRPFTVARTSSHPPTRRPSPRRRSRTRRRSSRSTERPLLLRGRHRRARRGDSRRSSCSRSAGSHHHSACCRRCCSPISSVRRATAASLGYEDWKLAVDRHDAVSGAVVGRAGGSGGQDHR